MGGGLGGTPHPPRHRGCNHPGRAPRSSSSSRELPRLPSLPRSVPVCQYATGILAKWLDFKGPGFHHDPLPRYGVAQGPMVVGQAHGPMVVGSRTGSVGRRVRVH